MLPLTYRPGSAEPQRLRNPSQNRGSERGLSLAGGLASVAVGVFALLIGLRVIEDEGKLHVPHWVMLPLGTMFAVCGLFVWWQTWRPYQAKRRHARMLLKHPDEPAFADYDWNPSGARSNLRAPAIRTTVIAGFFILFLVLPNYFAFTKPRPLFLIGIAGLLDVVTLFLIGHAALCWGRVLKFGQAELRFADFPFRTDKPVRLAWVAPSGCSGLATGSFTLRAVREWRESSGRGKSRSERLVHEQQWSGTWEINSPALIAPGMNCDLVFKLPPDAPRTNLHGERPFFWELEVALSLPGLDFKDTYLVPIYKAASCAV
ncbi:hypothetical protein [Geminisphaera colitermitum]|uniref:hypothetical protein n=1 Tax=Geminisphaera colitermitum TaxID=1148786 RepID=UPI000196519A|nr:hypothetical protein [Geminisphaera colitermitum]